MAEELTTTNETLDPALAYDIELAAREAAAAAFLAQQKLDSRLAELASEIEKKFDYRKNRRSAKDAQILESIRLYYGNVLNTGRQITSNQSPDRPFENSNSKRTTEYNIVKTKMDIAIAQAVSIQFGGGEKNWDILPSDYPTSDTGEPVDKNQAADAAERMEGAIDSQLEGCRHGYKIRQAIRDRVLMGSGIIKGPNNVLKIEKSYTKAITSKGTPTGIANLKPVEQPTIERVVPLFFYPDPTATRIEDCDDSIEVHIFSKNKLVELATNPNSGFTFTDNLKALIQEGPKSFALSDAFAQYVSISEGDESLKDKYLVLEYYGLVSEDLLLDIGKQLTYDAPLKLYMTEVWVCQGKIIRVELAPLDGCFEVPYAVCPWEPDPSSVLGFPLGLFLAAQQKVVNETYRMLLDNASVTSGPQVVINREVIEPSTGGNDWAIKPDKVWFSTELGDGDVNKAFQFFIPPNITESLQAIIMMAKGFSEEESGIPLMVAGLNAPQVADSVTGASIQQQNATIFSDYKNEEWDDCITRKVIQWFHDWNWEKNPRTDIRGDFKIDVKTSSDYRNKQIFLRNMEKLSLEAAQNPEMGRILDIPALQKAKLAMMSLPPAGIVKSDAQIAEEDAARAQQPDPARIDLELRQKELEIKQQELLLKQRELEFQQRSELQKAEWEHSEKLSANYARLREAEAQVITAEKHERIELLKLAQADEANRQKIMVDLYKTESNSNTQKFFKGIDYTLEARKTLLQEKELELAQQQGHGALSTI